MNKMTIRLCSVPSGVGRELMAAATREVRQGNAYAFGGDLQDAPALIVAAPNALAPLPSPPAMTEDEISDLEFSALCRAYGLGGGWPGSSGGACLAATRPSCDNDDQDEGGDMLSNPYDDCGDDDCVDGRLRLGLTASAAIPDTEEESGALEAAMLEPEPMCDGDRPMDTDDENEYVSRGSASSAALGCGVSLSASLPPKKRHRSGASPTQAASMDRSWSQDSVDTIMEMHGDEAMMSSQGDGDRDTTRLPDVPSAFGDLTPSCLSQLSDSHMSDSDVLELELPEPTKYIGSTNLPQGGWMECCRGCGQFTGASLTCEGRDIPLCRRCQGKWQQLLADPSISAVPSSNQLGTKVLHFADATKLGESRSCELKGALLRLDERWASYLGDLSAE